MTKALIKHSQSEVEERFLLHALRRLHTPEQRYVFTLMADLLSLGLASHALAAKKDQQTD